MIKVCRDHYFLFFHPSHSWSDFFNTLWYHGSEERKICTRGSPRFDSNFFSISRGEKKERGTGEVQHKVGSSIFIKSFILKVASQPPPSLVLWQTPKSHFSIIKWSIEAPLWVDTVSSHFFIQKCIILYLTPVKFSLWPIQVHTETGYFAKT